MEQVISALIMNAHHLDASSGVGGPSDPSSASTASTRGASARGAPEPAKMLHVMTSGANSGQRDRWGGQTSFRRCKAAAPALCA